MHQGATNDKIPRIQSRKQKAYGLEFYRQEVHRLIITRSVNAFANETNTAIRSLCLYKRDEHPRDHPYSAVFKFSTKTPKHWGVAIPINSQHER
jgi:hypothetical protein